MISRRFTLGQKAAAFAPVLFLLVYLPAQVMMRCRIDGMLRPICCCPHGAEPENGGPEIKAQDCCAREVTDSSKPVTAAAARPADREVSHLTAVALATPVVSTLASTFVSRDFTAQRYGPAREGPPLVLVKHAFLI